MNLRFLVNPTAGRGAAARQLETLRRLAADLGAVLEESASGDDLVARARRAAAEGVERLVVVGGDGTFHLAVQGLAQSDCALGLVPFGSGNDFAGTLGIPRNVAAAVKVAVSRPARRIDLGRVTGGAGSRWFNMYCGTGFDSEVTRHANQVRWLRGPIIYPWAVIKTLAGFRPVGFSIEYVDATGQAGRIAERGMFVTIANGPTFGGGMRIAPDARLDDGLFDLVFVREISKPKLLRVFPKVYTGAHVGRPELHMVRVRSVRIAVDRPLEVFGDGEPMMAVDDAGVQVEVVPKALAVVAGEGGSLDQPSEEEVEKLWSDEAERRIEGYRAGRVEAIPADEVFREAKRLVR